MNIGMYRGWAARGAAALALVLLLAACGTPAASTPTAAPTSAPAAPAATADPAAPSSAPAATPAPAATNAPGATAAPAASTAGAVQTLLDYYNHINQQEYDASYALWANKGAASGQTLDQFKTGFAKTVRVDVMVGEPSPAANGTVAIPATVLSVVNAPGITADQTIEQYTGTYTLAPVAGGWQIASASIAAANGGALPPAELASPESALKAYYAAITGQALAHAFTIWNGNGQASQHDFDSFAAGYAQTRSATVALGTGQEQGAAGSLYNELPAVVHATSADGSEQTFCGTYTMRRANVPPFDTLGWHIEGAKIAPHAAVAPGSPEEQQLLANGCA